MKLPILDLHLQAKAVVNRQSQVDLLISIFQKKKKKKPFVRGFSMNIYKRKIDTKDGRGIF